MCRFLSADFELSIRCPVNKHSHKVRLQAYPQLRGHILDVVACDAFAGGAEITCGKNCRASVESGTYWQRTWTERAERMRQ